MIRVVLDTNIIVSALLHPLGPPAQVLMLALGGSIQLCVSGSIYAEYEEVISRPRFQRREEIIGGALHAIREHVSGSGRQSRCECAPIRMMTFFWNAPRRRGRSTW